ncbi:pyrimidine-nucleoside phosphorylase [Acetivibrio cellulolyticus]|uniref:pyrimidine-nucleoside phosphorylase n=1 Tax=Acetivibrio cellulolyticus TaxID=35830 RepID=UPI0001E2E322|nr:pyrimidine-nucleoside phosphorylase [Acetivibrio cellulolyticus]
MRMYDVIEKKRDGKELEYEEISFFIKNYCEEKIPDYQVSALLMAIFLNGMSERETAELTEIMANSGDVIDLSVIDGIKVDKHSTGGVGDKTTLILGPIVAACGIPVAKMSGRGLGHTGGTIDKLESIPGFKTALTKQEFIDQVMKIGISIAGQTGNLAPADKKLYALRDVTATVNSLPLIASSIMSKKIACGADRIVLDVKTGSGALMKTVEKSVELARTMVKIGNDLGRKTVAVVTDMDIPLGNAIGNSLEVIEAIETLKGNGPKDLEEVSLALAAKMLELAEIGDKENCKNRVREVIDNRKALNKLAELIESQGGNPDVIENYDLFKKAKYVYELTSGQDCYIERVKTDSLGVAAMILGAGRETKESIIDYSAGIKLNKKTGMSIKKGELIATLYTNDSERINAALETLKSSLVLSQSLEPQRPLIISSID